MAAPQGGTEVLGVFRDERIAHAAAASVTRVLPSAGQPRVGTAADDVRSLQAEMREEIDNSFAGAGNVGPFTKEMTKGIIVGTILGTIIGFVATVPLGFVPWESIGLGPRLLVAALVGGFAGATMGFVTGGGFGAKDPSQPMAAEAGVTVAVSVASEADAALVKQAMEQHDPVRIDVTDAGVPQATLMTEEDGT